MKYPIKSNTGNGSEKRFFTGERTKTFGPIFRLIEVRMRGNLKKFIETCVREFDHLDVYQQEMLTGNIDKLIENKNHLSLQRTTKFIRKQLNKCSPGSCCFYS